MHGFLGFCWVSELKCKSARARERESLSIIRSLGVDRALGNVSGYVNARLNAQSTASGLLMAIRTAMHQWMAVLQM